MGDITFKGTDASLEISLLEYGLIVSEQEHEDGSGTHFCVYRQGDEFGTGHISEKQINGYVEGKEFMDENDIKEFLDWSGSTKEEWLAFSMESKLYDLLAYYGSLNIFGVEYSPMSEEEAKEMYLK